MCLHCSIVLYYLYYFSSHQVTYVLRSSPHITVEESEHGEVKNFSLNHTANKQQAGIQMEAIGLSSSLLSMFLTTHVSYYFYTTTMNMLSSLPL